ncbi:hypothetical protein Y1Q_0001350 [Alligator mississippiensis]|uniref:Uncharacterized protein n=1 Tax=Alligator mississippiensis TaxID=8496 RepID=A0A151M961_ALLMI|nr:hypothetical protein Y1Q_0001350 [Alligator mississippiensis]
MGPGYCMSQSLRLFSVTRRAEEEEIEAQLAVKNKLELYRRVLVKEGIVVRRGQIVKGNSEHYMSAELCIQEVHLHKMLCSRLEQITARQEERLLKTFSGVWTPTLDAAMMHSGSNIFLESCGLQLQKLVKFGSSSSTSPVHSCDLIRYIIYNDEETEVEEGSEFHKFTEQACSVAEKSLIPRIFPSRKSFQSPERETPLPLAMSHHETLSTQASPSSPEGFKNTL